MYNDKLYDEREFFLYSGEGAKISTIETRYDDYSEGDSVTAYSSDDGDTWYDSAIAARRSSSRGLAINAPGCIITLMLIGSALIMMIQIILRRKNLRNPYYTSRQGGRRDNG